MRVEQASVGSRVVDSLPFSQMGTAQQAKALAASGVDAFVGYLGVISTARLDYLLEAGIAFMPVTLAARYDGVAAVRQCKDLGLPAGVTVWLDVEGPEAWNTPASALSSKINAWASLVKAAGYQPGIYVGAPQPLSGEELFALGVVRYWLGIGRCVDRSGKDAYPKRGWCMRQDWHGKKNGMMWRSTGVLVDTNSVQCDHLGGLPSWVVGDTQEAA